MKTKEKSCVVILKKRGADEYRYLGKFNINIAKIMKEEYEKRNCEFLIFEEDSEEYKNIEKEIKKKLNKKEN